ncbi:hypothetical protein CIK06_16995 [Plantactinospora sp. KBS50]|nr:hypothetical protein CIK06_16995 [Plantactinospora sp. KBS50]
MLHAVRAAHPLRAAESLAWFTPGTPPGKEIVGYTLSARAAVWLRVGPDGTVQAVDGDPLAEAYEMLLFDGDRELRWLRTPDGLGRAVAVGEDPASLPPGDDVTVDQRPGRDLAAATPRRGDTQRRLLAGEAREHERTGWTALAGRRMATVALPMPFPGTGRWIAVETVEYLVEDGHGNLDVADSRTCRLLPLDEAQTLVRTAPASTHAERTTA